MYLSHVLFLRKKQFFFHIFGECMAKRKKIALNSILNQAIIKIMELDLMKASYYFIYTFDLVLIQQARLSSDPNFNVGKMLSAWKLHAIQFKWNFSLSTHFEIYSLSHCLLLYIMNRGDCKSHTLCKPVNYLDFFFIFHFIPLPFSYAVSIYLNGTYAWFCFFL